MSPLSNYPGLVKVLVNWFPLYSGQFEIYICYPKNPTIQNYHSSFYPNNKLGGLFTFSFLNYNDFYLT